MLWWGRKNLADSFLARRYKSKNLAETEEFHETFAASCEYVSAAATIMSSRNDIFCHLIPFSCPSLSFPFLVSLFFLFFSSSFLFFFLLPGVMVAGTSRSWMA